MKIKLLDLDGTNTGKLMVRPHGRKQVREGNKVSNLRTEFDIVELKKGRYVEQGGTSHPLRSHKEDYFRRVYAMEYKRKYIYYLDTFGVIDNQHGKFIGLNWIQNQRFLHMQNSHWIQKEENLRYLVNIAFLILGAWIAVRGMK